MSDHFEEGLGPGPKGCWARNSRGEPCGAAAMQGSKWCHLHSKARDDLQAFQSTVAAQRHVRPKDAPVAPKVAAVEALTDDRLRRSLETVDALLSSKLPGGEPNFPRRALGVALLAKLTGVTPEHALDILGRERRELARESAETKARLLDVELARQAIIDAYHAGELTEEELPPEVQRQLSHEAEPWRAFR